MERVDASPTKASVNYIQCCREIRCRWKESFWHDHNMPESLSAFCRIVSLTAAKTSRMFDVSVACVKLEIVSVKPKRWILVVGRTEDIS
jgi:hypothetical protein